MNLLIVNDEIRTANIMKRKMEWEKYGIEMVYTAYNAESGKTVIQEKEIDILLCDIEMPGENGLTLLNWIREEKYDIECIFLTCHADFKYAKEAISLGCQDYILMPTQYETIGDSVLKVAERIKERRKDAQLREYGKTYLLGNMEKKESEKKISPDALVAETKAYIRNHLGDRDLSVNSMAKRYFFHPVYLNRIFKQEEGISVSQFIMNERMQMAAVLLTSSDLTGTETAERVGYAYYTNFHNCFKRFYGCTPLQYKKDHQSGGSVL